MPFPANFLWGVATSAYQIEGAVTEDGRGETIWDRFSHTPGKIENGDTGDIACDHYHRWEDDINLLVQFEIPAYRFSIAWPRIMPSGKAPINQSGVAFYDRLVDRLLEKGIKPVATLYHFDLPVFLEDSGGWTERETAFRFRDYAVEVFKALGNRVHLWITHNDPFAQAAFGSIFGCFPPGKQSDLDGYIRSSHHLLLSHGLAVQAYHDLGLTSPIGITVGLAPTYPEFQSIDDKNAASTWDGIENLWFLHPLSGQGYPEETWSLLARAGVNFDVIKSVDLSLISQPLDFLGINYYTHRVIRAAPSQLFGCKPVLTGVRTTEMGWEIVPDGLFDLLTRISQEYQKLPLYITENGAAFPDLVDNDGEIRDRDRVRFLRDHIDVCEQAIAAGVDLRGYFVWSFLDNFEWQLGYRPRFGIVRVDYQTQRRIPKASAFYYREVIRLNGLPAN